MRTFTFLLLLLVLLTGPSYAQSVTIGTQTWMTKNLDVSAFRNGDPIPQAKTAEEWQKAGENMQPAWCYYQNDAANGVKYGKLYNWYAVNDPRGLASKGWHVPTDNEWVLLSSFLGGTVVAGTKMKSKNGWNNKNGTNESGFNGRPGGLRDNVGAFRDIGINGYWWSSSEEAGTKAVSNFSLYSGSNALNSSGSKKGDGFSVRCLKD